MTGATTHIGPGPRTLAKDRRSSQRRHPAATGTRVRRRPRQAPPPVSFYVLLVSVFVLCMLGLVMVLSASSIDALRQGTSGWTYFGRQALWATLGVVALLVAYRTPHRVVRALIAPGLLIVFVLNVAVAIPSIGVQVNGARAWFDLGPFGFQPSELLKLVLLVYAADLLSRRADRMGDLKATFRPLMIMLALASTLVLLQGDLGSAIVLATIVLAVAFIGGTPLGPLAAAGSTLFLAGAVFITSVPYRRERWLSFLDLANNRQDAGFQVWQSLIGIASGGVPGTGLGAGRCQVGLPARIPHRLHLRRAGRGAGPHRRDRRDRAVPGHPVPRGQHVAAGRRPLQPAAGRRHHRLDRRAGHHQHRGRDGHAPRDRAHPALPLVRRDLAARDHDRGGPPPGVRPHQPVSPAGDEPAVRRPGVGRAFAVVTGGGTAGHVLPALAVGEALVAHGHDRATIHYVGAERGIETRLVPPTGFPHTFLDVVGVQRRIERSNLSFAPSSPAPCARRWSC